MKKPRRPPPTIVIDTREQTPWSFAGMQSVVGTLKSGDYSLVGYEALVAIERKSLPDFVACCTTERRRFWAELERLCFFDYAEVIVEASLDDVWCGNYRSATNPWAVVTTARAIQVDFGIPVTWAGDRRAAARIAEWTLGRWHEREWERGLAQSTREEVAGGLEKTG